MEAEEITERTYQEYVGICDTIVETFGEDRPAESLTFDDLDRLRTILGTNKRGKRVSPYTHCHWALSDTHKRLLTDARMVFYHANERMGLSIRYKDALAAPPAKALRKARNKIGERLYTPKEVNTLIDAAEPELKAMIQLGINCGFGNRDCRMRNRIAQRKRKAGWRRQIAAIGHIPAKPAMHQKGTTTAIALDLGIHVVPEGWWTPSEIISPDANR